MTLLLNEWRLYFRQPWIICATFIYLAFALVIASGTVADTTSLEKQLTFYHMVLLMLALPILSAVLIPPLLQRDTQCEMSSLIEVTPTSRKTRLLSRAVAFFCTLFFATATGLLLQSLIALPQGGEPLSAVGLTLSNLVTLALPVCLLFTAIGLYFGERHPSSLSVYLTFTLLWGMYVVLGSLTGSPILAGSKIVSPVLLNIVKWSDPMGFTALFVQYADGLNEWHINASMLVNRLAWLALALLWLNLVIANGPPVKRLRTSKAATEKAKSPAKPLVRSPLFSAASLNIRLVLLSRATWIIGIIWVGYTFSEVMSGMAYIEPLSRIHPVSIDALNRVVWDVLPFGGCVLMALWSWQLCWRAKHHHLGELIGATPVSNITLITSQLASLLVMWILLLVVTGITTMVCQILAGSEITFADYVKALLLTGLPVILFGAVCLAIHHICKRAAIGGGIILFLLLCKFTPLMTMLGLGHRLWDIAGTTLQPADTLIGYQQSLGAFWYYGSYWFAVSVALLMLAVLRSHRGTGFTFQRWGSLPASGYIAIATLLISTGAFHFALYQENPLMADGAQSQFRVDYESEYGHWAHKVQPVITAIDSTIDFYPAEQQAKLTFDMTLTNRTDSPVERVLIGSYPGFAPATLLLENASMQHFDTALGQRVFTLDKPLLPGQSLHLLSEQIYRESQLWTSPSHQMVFKDFSYLRGIPLLPTVGFVEAYRLREDETRKEYKLAPLRAPKPSELTGSVAEASLPPLNVMMRSVISAPEGQIVISQGVLKNSWHRNGRVYREFATSEPVRAIPAWLSMTGTEQVQNYNGVKLRTITMDDKMSTAQHQIAMADTLEWFATHITPYPAEDLTLAFIPDIGPTGYALPQLILIDHNVGLRAHPSPDAAFDQRFRRTVHETAHQWFGHLIGYGVNNDRSFLIESLAKYVELVILEAHFGERAMQGLIEYERDRYRYFLQGNVAAPLALIDATQSPDVYSRATLVFARLRELVGDTAITGAIRQIIGEQQASGIPVVSMDFVSALLARTPEGHRREVKDLLTGTDVSALVKSD